MAGIEGGFLFLDCIRYDSGVWKTVRKKRNRSRMDGKKKKTIECEKWLLRSWLLWIVKNRQNWFDNLEKLNLDEIREVCSHMINWNLKN